MVIVVVADGNLFRCNVFDHVCKNVDVEVKYGLDAERGAHESEIHKFYPPPFVQTITEPMGQRLKSVMTKKIFCDKCGCELLLSELIELLGYDLCMDCCRRIVTPK